MESKIEILIIALFVLVVVLFILVINANMKYNRLKFSYNSFMKGKDGKTLEDSIFERFEELDNLTEMTIKNRQAIRKINEEMMSNFQKVGIVKYDAFNEMGGKLSFAITLLDGNNSGYIINSMHSREGCYNYVKEIVKGESYIELSEEEAESLDNAIFQETLGFDLENMK
jgi:hypothetical protein